MYISGSSGAVWWWILRYSYTVQRAAARAAPRQPKTSGVKLVTRRAGYHPTKQHTVRLKQAANSSPSACTFGRRRPITFIATCRTNSFTGGVVVGALWRFPDRGGVGAHLQTGSVPADVYPPPPPTRLARWFRPSLSTSRPASSTFSSLSFPVPARTTSPIGSGHQASPQTYAGSFQRPRSAHRSPACQSSIATNFPYWIKKRFVSMTLLKRCALSLTVSIRNARDHIPVNALAKQYCRKNNKLQSQLLEYCNGELIQPTSRH